MQKVGSIVRSLRTSELQPPEVLVEAGVLTIVLNRLAKCTKVQLTGETYLQRKGMSVNTLLVFPYEYVAY